MDFSHLLITRPEAESADLARQLSDSALVPVILPAYRFVPAYPGFELAGAWRSGRRLAVFSSTRAVEFGLRQMPAGFLTGVQLAAIGPASANALDAAGHGVDVVPEAGFTSEALLKHPELARDPGEAIIFAAPGGRVKLKQGLRELGWKVRMAYVYRRVEIEVPGARSAVLESATGVVSVWTSASAMKVLARQLSPAAWDKVCDGICVATSARLKAQLENRGAAAVVVADGPGNDAIEKTVRQLI